MMPIPQELRSLPHWVGWRHQRRDGRMTKIPYVLGENGRKARANDPSTWRPYADAVAYGPQYDGIGFELLRGGGLSAVDLDLCVERQTGKVAPWAREIVRRFDSYTEVTPSGEGLRIFCKGTLPEGEGWRNKRLGAARPDGHTAGCEVYSDGKYLTVTGEALPGTPEHVQDAQGALDWLQAHPPSLDTKPPLVAHTVTDAPLTDEELVKKASGAAHGDEFARLWAGDTSLHGGDDSRADAALCNRLAYWANGDRARMDRLFRKSGLYRPKWDERHGVAGQTYGDITLAFVLADFTKERANGTAAPRIPTATPQAGTLAELMAEHLEPPRHVVPGLIQRGLMILAGKPKIGKSWLVLNILLAVASGGLALGRFACERGDVLYLALEDPKYRLQQRARKLLLGAKPPDGFHYFLEWPRLDQGGLDSMDAWLEAHPAAALVVIDVWKRIKPPPAKGSNAYDSDYDAIILLQKLALKHDVCIVVVHHTNKNPSDDDTDVISGSIGFTGGADGHMVMKLVSGGNAVLRGRGREVEAFDLAIAFDKKLALWSVLGESSDVQVSAERRAVIALLEETQRRLRYSEVAQVLNRPIGPLRRLLWSMVKDGQIAGYPDHTVSVAHTDHIANIDHIDHIDHIEEEGDVSVRADVIDVIGVSAPVHIRCLKCGAPLTAQLQRYGYCRACSQGESEEF